MKRIALAAVLAGAVVAPALAQSSLQVYGRLNTTIERQRERNETEVRLVNNGSRLGFKGTEDLGGGLKANFLLEHRFNVDDGSTTDSSAFWKGDSWVGLSGGFGAVRLGRQTSALYYATADYVSLHNHDTGTSEDKLFSAPSRSTNKISYITPNMGGLQGEVQYSLKEDLTENQWEVALNYDLGPLHLGGGYTKFGDNKAAAIRALYEMGAFTFGGYYERDKFDDDKRNNYRLSAMYTFGASEIHANVGFADDWGDEDDTGARQYTVGYNYNLSKRTKLYTFYTRVRNDAGADYFPNTRDSAGNPNSTGRDFSSFAVGVRHNF